MITFFFGAGASMCLGLPDMTGLKEEMNRKCKTTVQKSIISLYVNQNVEELCKDIKQALEMKNNKILSTMQHGINHTSVNFAELYKELEQLQPLLRDILLDKLEPSDDLESYEEMLDKIGIGTNPSNIITTNYDLILDKVLELEMVDGFIKNEYKENTRVWEDYWERGKYDTLVVKLHGSINWQYNKDKRNRTPNFDQHVYPYIEKLPGPGYRGTDRDAMLLPALNDKDYEKQPFNALYRQFKKILDDTDLLVSIGYSFKDEHINKEIKKRLGNGITLLSVMPNALQKTTDAFQEGEDTDNNPTRILVCNGTPYAQSNHTNYNLFVYEVKFEQHTADNIRIVIEAVRAHIDGQQIEFNPLNKKERKRHNCQPVD